MPPVGGGDWFDVVVGNQIVIYPSALLANDTDANGDVITLASFTQPIHGTLTEDPEGYFVYTSDGTLG